MAGGNDYVIQVKGNQKILHSKIKKIASGENPIDTYITKEKHRGRTEHRKTEIYNSSKRVDEGWKDAHRIIKVTNSGIRNHKSYEQLHYYLSSCTSNSAEFFGRGIRSHWGIENQLHWVKDVVLNEDKSRIKCGRLVSNLSLIKAVVISLYRINGQNSITKAIEKYSNKIEDSLNLMKHFRTHMKN